MSSQLLVRALPMVAMACCWSSGVHAAAPDFPTRPIRLVVNFAPGGTGDIIARAVAQRLTEKLGQAVIVDNRGGAGGVVGANIVAKSPADGYTLLLGSNGALTISPSMGKLPYDSLRDFTAVGLVATSQFILVVHPTVAAKSVKELIALAKEKPRFLSYGSAGTGSVAHLAAELFKSLAGIDMVHVPYKGSGPMTVDLLAGHVQLSFPGLSSLVPYVKSGNVRALAVSGNARSAVLPDLPTISEAGLPGYEASTFWGVLGPAGMPPALLKRLNGATVEIVKHPDLRAHFINLGIDPLSSTTEEFSRQMKEDTAKWAKIIKISGAKLD